MTPADRADTELRVLVLAPTGRDTELTRTVLGRTGLHCLVTTDPEECWNELHSGLGALVLPEEFALQDGNHALRNPLAPIRNCVQILRLSGTTDPSGRYLCEILERQVNHMVRLVEDLIEVSRITRGKIELRRERVDLGAILRNSAEISRPLVEAG